jgi:hypothetical protein
MRWPDPGALFQRVGNKHGKNFAMSPFGKDFYRALVIGFLIGCAGMALSVSGVAVHAHAVPTGAIAGINH